MEIREYYLDYLVTPDILELRKIAAVGEGGGVLINDTTGVKFRVKLDLSERQRKILLAGGLLALTGAK